MILCIAVVILFQSTPSVWRETYPLFREKQEDFISIHSLRVEGDLSIRRKYCNGVAHFNPLPPCGGRHLSRFRPRRKLTFQSTPSVWRETTRLSTFTTRSKTFQSTPSVWRETTLVTHHIGTAETFQSTPSVWRETYITAHCRHEILISIHSLRVEGDRV